MNSRFNLGESKKVHRITGSKISFLIIEHKVQGTASFFFFEEVLGHTKS